MIKIKHVYFNFSSIVSSLIILLFSQCDPRCGFNQEPYFNLQFADSTFCENFVYNYITEEYDSVNEFCGFNYNAGANYEFITGDNLSMELDSIYEGPEDNNIPLPIDMNRDYVQFYLINDDFQDTIRLDYTRTFERENDRCKVVCIIDNIEVTTNFVSYEFREGSYDEAEPASITIFR